MDPNRIEWYCRLSSAASRHSDLRQAAHIGGPGSPAAVAYADGYATLADLRTAHTLACGGVTPDDVNPTIGILTAEASVRLYGWRRRSGAPNPSPR